MSIINSGNFFISPALPDGTRDETTEIVLTPNPTYVDYGERLRYKVVESEARAIKQLSHYNPGEKAWVWENYRSHVPRYEDQYGILFGLQEHIRTEVLSGSPYVYLKDTVTPVFGKYNVDSGTIVSDWIRCRVLKVDRDTAKNGGVVTYPKTEFVFTVDDDSFTLY